MRSRGQGGGPFQLFIAIVVMGMSLAVGFYLINMVNCWKCDESAKIVASNLKETIANVGKGDIGTADAIMLNLPDCIEGIFLKQVGEGSTLAAPCRQLCPAHPITCWVIIVDSRCSGRLLQECIDIAGDTVIAVEDYNPVTSKIDFDPDQWIQGSFPFTMRTYNLRISKEPNNEILLGKP